MLARARVVLARARVVLARFRVVLARARVVLARAQVLQAACLERERKGRRDERRQEETPRKWARMDGGVGWRLELRGFSELANAVSSAAASDALQEELLVG